MCLRFELPDKFQCVGQQIDCELFYDFPDQSLLICFSDFAFSARKIIRVFAFRQGPKYMPFFDVNPG